MKTISQQKEILRQHMKRIVRGFSPDYIQHTSQKITDTIITKYLDVHRVRFVFVSFPDEVHTDRLIQILHAHKKIVCIPHMEGKNMQIVLEKSHEIYTGPIDITITPGLAFDKKNNRLGRGGGNYDAFFAQHPETIKCGICFREQIREKVPTENHDIPVHEVVTA